MLRFVKVQRFTTRDDHDTMDTPRTPDELRDAFERHGYRKTIETYGAAPLTRHFTVNEIVWIAWDAREVEERTVYYRKKKLRSLVCG